jgi:hypothetical protein
MFVTQRAFKAAAAAKQSGVESRKRMVVLTLVYGL